VEELAWRVDAAAAAGLELRIEAHLGSIVSTPELVQDLVGAVPGMRLALDPSHFVTQSIGMDRIRPLAADAGHVHVRGAKPGIIQTAWSRNETDFDALLDALTETRYAGVICVEYVPMEQWRCDEMDVLTSVVETKSAFEALLARRLEAVRS
jgi:sugar phosphate isomerase/epimerase